MKISRIYTHIPTEYKYQENIPMKDFNFSQFTDRSDYLFLFNNSDANTTYVHK